MGHLLLLWSICALQGASTTASWNRECGGKGWLIPGLEPCTEDPGDQPTGEMKENSRQPCCFLSSKSHLSSVPCSPNFYQLPHSISLSSTYFPPLPTETLFHPRPSAPPQIGIPQNGGHCPVQSKCLAFLLTGTSLGRRKKGWAQAVKLWVTRVTWKGPPPPPRACFLPGNW